MKLKHYSLNNSFSSPPSPLTRHNLGKHHSITFHPSAAAAAAKSLQSFPTLCNPIDGSPPGSSIPGILQARTLEWVAISFSNAWKWKVKAKSLSLVRLLATPWTAALQAPLHGSLQARVLEWGAIAFSIHPYEFEPTLGTHISRIQQFLFLHDGLMLINKPLISQ